MNTFAIVDLETTGNSATKGDRIIEIAIILYRNGQIIKQYNQLLDPKQHISRFITYLTGITNEMVTGKPTFEDVAQEVYDLFDQAYFVAHNVPFDLGFLNVELKRVGLPVIKQPVIDTVELSRILLPQAPSFKLAHLSEWLDLKHDDPHRALSDAYVTTELLEFLLNKLTRLPHSTIEQLLRLEADFKSDLQMLLVEQKAYLEAQGERNNGFHHAYQLAYKPIEQEKINQGKLDRSFGVFLDDLFSEQTSLKKVFTKYEDRPGQREMAELIYHAFQSDQHAMIEAGTGIGKTLAYLIAASYHSVKSGERVVISTYLIQLQKQLINEDWEQLKKVLPFHCQIAVLKGKSHYLNLALLSQAMNEKSHNYDQVLSKAILLVWITETNTGDVDEIQLPSSGYRLFKRISARNETEVISNQSDANTSYYKLARERAEKADLVVINHSLLADSINRDNNFLKENDRIIVDEAHHLERAVSDSLGLQIDSLSYHKTLRAVEKFIDQLTLEPGQSNAKLDSYMNLLLEENELFFRYIYHLASKNKTKAIAKNDLGRSQFMIEANDQTDWTILTDMAERLQFNFHDLIQLLNQLIVFDYDLTRRDHFVRELNLLKQTLKQYFNQDSFELNVNWIEIERTGTQGHVYLYRQPIDTAQFLKRQFFDRFNGVVLTSASLSVSEKFTFFKNQFGLGDQDLIEQRILSPYHFHDQVKLLIPNDFPPAKYDEMDPFIEATCEAIYSLADVTDGRMLVLFNSYDLLKKAYHLLHELFNDEYLLIAQGISSGSHERLKKNFQNFDRSILLGTHAFWEGLDIPGSDLRCVVMVRLPFDSPNHPIIKEKHDLIKQTGNNPFLKLSLPNAVIRFKQGFGRLIRSETDRGIVFVCDDRLMTKSYGQSFIESIPNVPIFYRSTNELLEISNHWI